MPSRIQGATTAVLFAGALALLLIPKTAASEGGLLWMMWGLFVLISIYLAKLVFIIVDLIARIPQIWGERRLHWLTHTGVVLALVVFCSMWWGALVNRFNINVVERTVYVHDLPPAFDGFKIAQISDLHVGTLGSDTTLTHSVVAQVNALHPDLVVFTGDLVNRHSTELLPHTGPLSQLQAPYGVISILGNHDYGDYYSWPSAQAKTADVAALVHTQRTALHWQVLLNEHRMLHRGTDSIAVIGVENIGDPPFKIYGSLSQAYPSLSDSVTKILLSHNPVHWTDSIRDNSRANVALTLAGHTHAMQIQVGPVSPAALRYDTWMGLYSSRDSLRQLYVNIGAGTVGMPMRLGATPEITLITLRDKR